MSTRLPSIRQRLMVSVVGLAMAWALLGSAAVWWTLRHEVDELLDDTLVASSEVLIELLHPQNAPQEAAAGRPGPWTATPSASAARYAWQWIDPSGRLRARSPLAASAVWFEQPTPGWSHRHAADGHWRIYGRHLPDGSMLYVAQTQAERVEARADVVLSVTAISATLAIVFIAFLHQRLRRELHPLTALSEAVARHDPLHDSALPGAQRLELEALREALLTLGQHLRQRLMQERAVAAQVAHALRTPLAGLDAQLAAAQVAPPQRQTDALARAREASRQLRRVVSAIISLYRSSTDLRRRCVDLKALLEALPAPDVSIELAASPTVWADPDLLAAALSNLLDNAQRYGARRVRIESYHDADGHALVICDDGPGLPDTQRARLQQALDAQAYEGRTGLGLMLADLVARAHGGRVRLHASGGGLRVHLGLGPLP